MIVAKVKDSSVNHQDAYSTWKAFAGVSGSVCSTEGCKSSPTTSLQVRMYGLSETYIAPICSKCAESKATLTDLKEDTVLVPLEINQVIAV